MYVCEHVHISQHFPLPWTSSNIFCTEPEQTRSRPIGNRALFVSGAFAYLGVSVLAMLPVVTGVMSILS